MLWNTDLNVFGLGIVFKVIDANRRQVQQYGCNEQEEDQFFTSDQKHAMKSLNRLAVSDEFGHPKESWQAKGANRPKVDTKGQEKGNITNRSMTPKKLVAKRILLSATTNRIMSSAVKIATVTTSNM